MQHTEPATTISQRYFNQIHKTINGWMVIEKMEKFEEIFNEFKQQGIPKVTAVEIGVFYGKSAIAQGIIAKELQQPCKIYAIDAWSADASLEGKNDPANDNWWKEIDYQAALQAFIGFISDYELKNIYDVQMRRSEEAVQYIPDNIDLLHIDGNHSEEKSCLDVELYLPKVRKGGYIFMDDTNWATTHKAVEMLRATCEMVDKFDNGEGAAFEVYKKG